MSNIAWMVHTDTTTGFITGVHSIPGDVTLIPSHGEVRDSETIYLLTREDETTYNIVNVAQFMRTYHRDSSGWVFRGVPANDFYIWESNSWNLDSTRMNAEIRLQRGYKLGMSDWTQANDSPLSDSKKTEWATYRQALRDIMTNLPADLDDPENVVWPTEPS
ncbi:MAG: tail fiber assembly protein [Methylophagaceae bacterium]|jgi:hypothetical protein|tara:strand:- start:1147 stop:1632 length:486 start_codon:yes stop_codon:yes gene_type:complete